MEETKTIIAPFKIKPPIPREKTVRGRAKRVNRGNIIALRSDMKRVETMTEPKELNVTPDRNPARI